jgi:signal transduction histidine kinase
MQTIIGKLETSSVVAEDNFGSKNINSGVSSENGQGNRALVNALASSRTYREYERAFGDMTERKRLEKEILEISEREQRRIGQDLHDGLCQHLAGVEMLSQVLAMKLAPRAKAEAGRATDIAKSVREAISQTRLLARGLSPVTLESEGLMAALTELALNTEKLFGVNCRFDCPEVVKFDNHAAATHLFRIAQEAVSNAIKHGKAKTVSLRLRDESGQIHLRIGDDGKGFSAKPNSKGMGLRIMQSRISMVGGTLTIERLTPTGTAVNVSAPK